ncbi:hypothetical protein [Flammeovirga sp. SJP92]|uniref:hypothetical protein n=1 Tax=Flammeovirga sp. SJP92 TaxID=1775430 RepID=UPI000787499D|nr:hypothetical protein [Flammeovirga sp. SJP92]KXX69835.1 hypothetical protein AVL50_13170 [Flammeovirga sp. SJP92]
MLKLISKLLLFISIPLFIISCGSDEEAIPGNATFYADETVGFSKQQITITITDNNDDPVKTGVLRQYATDPNCGMTTGIDVFTVDLPEGSYFVYAVESDDDSVDPPLQGAWFTGLEGYKLEITSGTCQRFVLGEDPFEERPNPNTNTRLKGFKQLSITLVGESDL